MVTFGMLSSYTIGRTCQIHLYTLYLYGLVLTAKCLSVMIATNDYGYRNTNRQRTWDRLVIMAQWSAADVDSLPDSSFAFVSGDTRKLPYKDKDGNVDLPHVRNALARLDQTQGIPESEKAAIKAKLEKALGDDNDSKEGSKLHALPDDMI